MGQNIFGTGKARVCAVIATARARDFRELVRLALKQASTVELRLDWLKNNRERHASLDWLKRAAAAKRATFIATCRRRIGGGEFAGTAADQLFWLMKAKDAGCAWCDLEIETVRDLRTKSLCGYELPPKVMMSMHDFRSMPDIAHVLRMPKVAGVAALKIAGMCRRLPDSIGMLHKTRHAKDVVAIPMGEIGLPGRILGLREGGALLYAPVAAATAPGQVPLEQLLHLYRAHELSASSRVYGVIGNPVGHSLSPLLHNTGYVAAKKDAVYVPFLVENVGEFVKAVPEFGVNGFSVTMPHKQAILRYLDECEPLAEQIGAVNTVTVRRDGKLVGSNTDYVAVLKSLERKMRLEGKRVVVLGAGGAARAAAFALAKAGAEVLVWARRESAARALARAVHGAVIPRQALRKERLDAVLNTTPVGMPPHEKESPLLAAELNCSLVMDIITRPLKTKLLRVAEKRGIPTISGVEMFVAQGVAQWELWMGTRAPEAAMRRAVVEALKTEDDRRN